MASRRDRHRKKAKRVKYLQEATPKRVERAGWERWYEANYKKLLLIPFILLALALLQIGVQTATTGDFLNKGVSLQGGLTLTIPATEGPSPQELEDHLASKVPNEVIVRGISELGSLRGYTIEVASGDETLEKTLIAHAEALVPVDEYSAEVVGPSLGAAFFRQTIKAVIGAFLLMGLIVFYVFGQSMTSKLIATALSIVVGTLVAVSQGPVTATVAALLGLGLVALYVKDSPPSAAVILAAFSDIVVTLAVVNLLGVKLSTAGIAAFLMLIGYSVDTDILLSTRVLKRSEGTVTDRILKSLRTGLTMTVTSIGAAIVALLVTQSDTIRQIMLIILIGLIVDIINTWLQNAGIIRWYAERRSA